MILIVTIDVEEDNPWKRPETAHTLNSRYVPRFQTLCERYGIKPTYLCSYEMVQCGYFKEFIEPVLEKENAEVGAHLHPWRCPPHFELTGNDFRYLPYPHEYPDDLFRRKLEVLIHEIRENIGIRPESYRAGRWGFVQRHVPILEELGLRVDSSVTPRVSWAGTPGLPEGAGGIDFSSEDVYPHYLPRDPESMALSGILEVPVTVLFPLGLFNRRHVQWEFFTDNKIPLLGRLMRGLGLAPQWFRPYAHMSAVDLIRLYRRAVEIKLPCVNMMFHSNELMPGGSPYNPDERSVDCLYEKLGRVFDHLRRENVRSMTLSGFAARRPDQSAAGRET